MGGVRVATWAAAGALALLLLASACGGGRGSAFCGLARTVNGFDPVEAVHGVGCGVALRTVAAVERGQRGPWDCSRAMHALYELDCRRPGAEVQVLERAPVPALRRDGAVSVANWSFRLSGNRIAGRTGHGRWLGLAGPPFCVPAVPREALVALRLRPLTPSGGCFGLPRPLRR